MPLSVAVSRRSAFAHKAAIGFHAGNGFVVGGEYILFAKGGHENLLILRAVVIPGQIDGAIGGLLSVRVGAADSFINDEALRPGAAIIL